MSLLINAFLSPPAKVLRSIAGVDPQSLQNRNLYKEGQQKMLFILLVCNYDDLLVMMMMMMLMFTISIAQISMCI